MVGGGNEGVTKYVYDYMSDSLDISTGRDAPEDEIFELLPIDFQVILNSRTRLLVEALKFINGISDTDKKHDIDSFIRIADILKDSSEESVLMQISRLGHHGYRSLVDFISSLAIDPRDDILFKRFFENQSHTMILLYIAKLKHKYAQRKNHFPNIFLNDTIISYNSRHNPILEAHKTHKHTYWLKYFILKYIVKYNGASMIDILDEFLSFYPNEEHLIRHILGSLCTANEFSCAEVPLEYDTNPDNLHISPTDRARELYSISYISKKFKNKETEYPLEFCFDYSYLSCIIDDDWMSYPKHQINKIFNKKLSHRHLLTTGEAYQKTTSLDLKERHKLVLTFIKLLKESLNYELITKSEYKEFLNEHELIPNFEDIVHANILLMVKIAKSLGLAGKIDFYKVWEDIDSDVEISEFYQRFVDNDFYPPDIR